jgi:hypothetical protein
MSRLAKKKAAKKTVNTRGGKRRFRHVSDGVAEKIAERRALAIQYRKERFSYREIAQKTDVSLRTAFQDVQAVLSELVALGQEIAEEHVELELERLDAGTMAVNEKAAAGNIGAIEAQRKHGESRRKLLGQDAVGKHEHSIPGGQPIPVITEIRRVIVYPKGKEP